MDRFTGKDEVTPAVIMSSMAELVDVSESCEDPVTVRANVDVGTVT
jgi:hypothetical protein